jgi:ribulose-phosphate 3-epimerase
MGDLSPVRIAPSLLSCDFARLADEIRDVEAGGADWLHVDVMDGHFVPNLTIGPPVVAAIHKAARVPLDVHLMITDPWRYADAFLDAGARILTFHAELGGDQAGLCRKIRGRGAIPGISINPDTPVERIAPLLPEVGLVLVMSVFPGFGGQKFMSEVLTKVRRLRGEYSFRGHVEMDGGINPQTIGQCAQAGTDTFVAGTAVFGEPDRKRAVAQLRSLAESGRAAAGMVGSTRVP